MKEVRFGSSSKLDIAGANVAGFSFTARMQHTTANTAFAANPFNALNVQVKCLLSRNKKQYVIFADVLMPLALDSSFYDGGFEQLLNIGTVGYNRVVVAAGGIKEILEQTYYVRLHDVINVSQDDVLTIEIQLNANAVDANVDTGNSVVQYDYIEGIGNGFSIPTISAHSVNPAKSSETVSIGNQVAVVRFFNIDKVGVTDANKVLSSVMIRSDKLPINDTFAELLLKRYQAFPSLALANARHQSFELASIIKDSFSGADARLNDVKVDLVLNAGNVNSSQNFVVWRGYQNDGITVGRARGRFQKHQAENISQYTMNS